MAAKDGRDLPRVAVVVVNWNGVNDTIELVASLLAQTYPNLSISVVDNGSDGGDAEALAQRFGARIRLVELGDNRGCGGGYNAGVRAVLADSPCDFIVIMNNDMTSAPDMVSELVSAAEAEAAVGVVGAKIYFAEYDGRRDVLWSAGGRFHPWGWRVHSRRGAGRVDEHEFDSAECVEWVSGATMLFRPEVYEAAGPFNERHILGYEDMEFCRRATAAGYGILFAPRARSWHKVGVSAEKAHIKYTNPAAYYEFIRNCFPAHVYAFHICLLPSLLIKWGLLYLLRSRDSRALRDFARQLGAFVVGR